jgi:hypothetical protein
MTKRILRSFLYLDENIVDDYLAQFEGGILEGPYSTKDTTTGSREGGGGLKFGPAEGSGKGAYSSYSETTQTIRETPVTKFTRLYNLLEEDDAIQPLNGFDLDVYKQIQLGEIIEVRGEAKLPQWEHLAKAVSDFSSLIEIMKAVGQDPLANNDTNQAYQGFSALIAKKVQEDIELIISPIGSPSFKFVAKLDTTRILRRKEDFETEVTILGKVRRKLAERETIDIFRVAPQLSQLKNLNRAQRRGTSKNKAKMPSTDTPFDEVVKFPAMQIQPIAIYQ